MGKRRAGKREGRDVEQEVAAVLAGNKDVPARRLVDLIHEVNPTGRDLPQAEAERRYATKSRLQSLLVRRFGEELEVRPDPQTPDAVSIRHRYSDLSASHTVVDTLEEDARSWVRFRLDADIISFSPGMDMTGGRAGQGDSDRRRAVQADGRAAGRRAGSDAADQPHAQPASAATRSTAHRPRSRIPMPTAAAAICPPRRLAQRVESPRPTSSASPWTPSRAGPTHAQRGNPQFLLSYRTISSSFPGSPCSGASHTDR